MARTTTSTPSPLDTAVSNVHAWQEEATAAADAVTRWEAERPAAPQDSTRIAQERVTSRERIRVAADALQAARDAETSARRALVAEEAERMAPAIASLQRDLDAHRARTAELLEPLREHTGRNWAPVPGPTVHRLMGERVDPSTVTAPAPLDRQFEARLERLQRQQEALRAAARGEEPSDCGLADLPDSLRVGGVLPARVALDQAERDAEAAAHAAEWSAMEVELGAAIEVIGADVMRAALADLGPGATLSPRHEYQRPGVHALEAFRDSVRGVSDDQKAALVVIARIAGIPDASRCFRKLTAPPPRPTLSGLTATG
jgi:hypothetical protein